MAPGNLNLKKSWHPGLLKNQKKVWEAEQEALSERKKIQERQEEISKQRELAELRGLQHANGGKKVQDRVEWMYDTSKVGSGGAADGGDGDDEYLLGKKRVDQLIVNAKVKESKQGFDKLQDHGASIPSQQQELSMSRDDPMVKIRQQQALRLRLLKERRDGSRSREHRSRDGERREERHRGERHRGDDRRGERHSHGERRGERHRHDDRRGERHSHGERREHRHRDETSTGSERFHYTSNK